MKFFAQATILLAAASNVASTLLQDGLPVLMERGPVSLVERDLASVSSAVTTISTALKAATSEAQAFTNDPTALNAAMQALSSSIKSGTTAVEASAPLTLQDATQLAPVVQGLGEDAKSLAAALSAKKGALEQAGQCPVLLASATDIVAAVEGLVAAIISKIPQEARGPATMIAGIVTTSVRQGLQLFAPANCRAGAGAASAGTVSPQVGATTPPLGQTAGSCVCSTTTRPVTAVPATTSTNRPSSSSARPSNGTTTRPATPVVTAGGSKVYQGMQAGLVGMFALVLFL